MLCLKIAKCAVALQRLAVMCWHGEHSCSVAPIHKHPGVARPWVSSSSKGSIYVVPSHSSKWRSSIYPDFGSTGSGRDNGRRSSGGREDPRHVRLRAMKQMLAEVRPFVCRTSAGSE